MLVVSRFRAPDAAFRTELVAVRDLFARYDGFLRGRVGRNLDEPDLWVLVTEWASIGAYRRALSSYDVKMQALPTLYRAVDEPSAYEDADDGADLNVAGTRSIG